MRMAIAVLVAMVGLARADDAPSLVVVIDRTLPSDKLATITEAIKTTAKAMPEKTELAIVLAGPQATLVGPLGAARKIAISGVRGAGRADLGAAIGMASRVLKPSHARARRILVMTDGDDLTALGRTAEYLSTNGIRVSAIGYQSFNRVVLQDLAKRGGGRLFLAENPRELAAAFEAAGTLVPLDQALAVAIVIAPSRSEQTLEREKETARIATEVLSPDDMVTVIVADHDGTAIVPMERAGNRMRHGNAIARLSADGRAYLASGLTAARDALKGVDATSKLVVLLTLGIGSMDDVPEAAQALRAANVGLVVVGSKGADRAALEQIAGAGNGRLYLIEDDIGSLPKVFMNAHPEPW